MDSVNTGLNTLLILIMLLFVMGLFKPHIVLWWEDRQNRIKVILIYGMSAVIILLLKLVLNTLIQA